ncbi:ATP-binding protein [Streptomyces sp. N50]|uniref:ATP-binding protein n=1 Tax=Streptomyces sp. N50 TaxID=3081765 RepID=UPI00296223F2|nr:ATP-binding protein [Streptomyces sp. N50]WOX11816.1 ATP-binding protein [Streptomyces sp. N50]
MDIDTTQPWGLAIDFAGRATITEAGHTIYVNVSDSSYNSIIAPDSVSGTYAPVTVAAQFTEWGANGSAIRGSARTTIMPIGTAMVVPDQTAIQTVVASALANFVENTAAYTTLAAKWTPPTDGSGEGDGDGDGDGDGTEDPTATA